MKNITLYLIIILLTAAMVSGQDCYTVLKVKGDVKLERTGKYIAVNDELCSNDNVLFSDNNCVVVVHSTNKGRFTLKPTKQNYNELEYYVSDILRQSSNLSTRGANTLSEEFSGDYCIIGETKIIIDKLDFPMNENKFFYLSYITGSDTVYRKIKFFGDTLIIEKEGILKDDVFSSDYLSNVNLYYYDNVNKVSKLINTFNLNFIHENELKDNLGNYLTILRKAGRNDYEIKNEFYFYFNDIYGKVNKENFLHWVENNLNLK